MTEKQLIWLDCDPGHDDFFAILLAGLHPKYELLGLSTVGGNQTVDKVTKNALNALHLVGLDHIPCCRGQEHALMSETVACPEIHGESGLDLHGDVTFPIHTLQQHNENWLAYMANTIINAPRRVVLAAVGRLTNIALLLQVYPQVMRNIENITIMGGAMKGGNTHPVAEFNIQGDPEAAQIVFNRGSSHSSKTQLSTIELASIPDSKLTVPILLSTLEVTHTVIVNNEVLDLLEKSCVTSNSCGFYKIARSLLLFFTDSYQIFGFKTGPPLHDPVAVYFSLCPEEFESTHYRVDVECNGTNTRGQTVVDIWSQTKRLPNVHVATKLNVDAFWKTMSEIFTIASQRCIVNKV